MPAFEEYAGGFQVTFSEDLHTPEQLQYLGLSARQIQVLQYVKEEGRISNQAYQEVTGVKKHQASQDLSDLDEEGILVRIGNTGRGTYYVLKEAEGV